MNLDLPLMNRPMFTAFTELRWQNIDMVEKGS